MTTLSELVGTGWKGRGELWLDPLGDQAAVCDCTLAVEDGAVTYHWSHEGTPHTGTLALRPGGADFTDTFHSPVAMACHAEADRWGLFGVFGTYSGGEGPAWGWRIALALRPTGELLLQMTNIAPWGEEVRAVRMTCTRS